MFGGGTTWTLTRDTVLGLDFTGVYFYDGQGFLVHRELGIDRVADLDGAQPRYGHYRRIPLRRLLELRVIF